MTKTVSMVGMAVPHESTQVAHIWHTQRTCIHAMLSYEHHRRTQTRTGEKTVVGGGGEIENVLDVVINEYSHGDLCNFST